MLAVGVDVSNGKSTVAILRSKTNAVCKPFDVKNTADGLADLVAKLNTIEGEKKGSSRKVRERDGEKPDKSEEEVIIPIPISETFGNFDFVVNALKFAS